jgi:hypothetical protein
VQFWGFHHIYNGFFIYIYVGKKSFGKRPHRSIVHCAVGRFSKASSIIDYYSYIIVVVNIKTLFFNNNASINKIYSLISKVLNFGFWTFLKMSKFDFKKKMFFLALKNKTDYEPLYLVA